VSSAELERDATLLAYPAGEDLDRIVAVLREPRVPPEPIAEAVRTRKREELEELYTRTFDINPVCSLEVGWHLYGEDYNRGSLLVYLRGLLRSHGVEEGAELPDHLASVLRLLARLPRDEAGGLARRCVLPAVVKMNAGLAGEDNPYSAVLRGVEEHLRAAFGEPEAPQERSMPYDCAAPCRGGG